MIYVPEWEWDLHINIAKKPQMYDYIWVRFLVYGKNT